MKQEHTTILFWGATWGLVEATLGYVLHYLAVAIPGLPGFIMFPVALFFMHQVYQHTSKASAIMAAAGIAAMIKLTDLAFGGLLPIFVINPALALLMEGLVVTLLITTSKHLKQIQLFSLGFLMSIGWRSVFLLYMLVISRFGLPAGLVTNGIALSLRFLLLESGVNAILIGVYLSLVRKPNHIKVTQPAAFGMLMMAILLQWLT